MKLYLANNNAFAFLLADDGEHRYFDDEVLVGRDDNGQPVILAFGPDWVSDRNTSISPAEFLATIDDDHFYTWVEYDESAEELLKGAEILAEREVIK